MTKDELTSMKSVKPAISISNSYSPTIFISYAREDSDFVDRLKISLSRAHIDVWVDRNEMYGGQNWKRVTHLAISECTCLLLVLSPESLSSDYVRDEYLSAIKLNKIVIPLNYRSNELPVELMKIQAIDFQDNYYAGSDKLLSSIRLLNSNSELYNLEFTWPIYGLVELINILRDAPESLLVRYSAKHFPADCPMQKLDSDSVTNIIKNLALKTTLRDGSHPLIVFVEQIRLAEKSLEMSLQKWEDSVSFFNQLDETILISRDKVLPHYNATDKSIQPYVLIKVAPDDPRSEKYLVEAFLYLEKSKVYDVKEKSYDFEHLSQAFGDVFIEIERYLIINSIDNEPIIELMLPIKLLTHDIDQWQLSRDHYSIPISLCFPVVVRSLDRAYCRENDNIKFAMRRQWKNKWNELNQSINPIKLKTYDSSIMDYKFPTITIKPILCMGLTFSPNRIQNIQETGIIADLIHAGVPVAVWPRKEASISEVKKLRSLFRTLFLKNNIITLPQNLLQKRRKQLKHLQHLIHSITLLWDDPGRLPPDTDPDSQLEEPIKEGQ